MAGSRNDSAEAKMMVVEICEEIRAEPNWEVASLNSLSRELGWVTTPFDESR